jgi:hypothetical protein
MNIIICIIYENEEYIIDIKNTYLNLIKYDHNIKYYFIKNKNHFNIIEEYNNQNYDFILITYYNSFININNLINFLKTLDSTDILYIGGHGDYRKTNITFWFHSPTPGIIFTKNACKLLLNTNLMDEYNKICQNDIKNISGVAIGYYSTIFNIKYIFNNNFSYCNFEGYPCHINKINKLDIICCSNMAKEDFYNYYNYLIFNNYKTINNIQLQNNNIQSQNKIIMYPIGGFGNLLFQYFVMYSISKDYNFDIYFQINYDYWRGNINKYTIFSNLNFIDTNKIDTSKYIDYKEIEYNYSPIKLDTNNNYKICGYYQSYKYSEKYITDIKNILFFNISTIYQKIENMYYNYKKNFKSCLIHVRRGDYLYLQHIHTVLTDDYYIKAINLFKENYKFFIFSDDPIFLLNWNVIKNINYQIINLSDPQEILIFMSLCDNFIIANSSLSLCSYLLRKNNDAKLIAPKNWFSNNINFNIYDFIPYNATLI